VLLLCAAAAARIPVAAGPPEIQAIQAIAASPGIVTIQVIGKDLLPGASIFVGGAAAFTEQVAAGRLRAAVPLSAAPGRLAAVQVVNPNGAASAVMVTGVEAAGSAVSERAAVRFLEQAAWGPSPESVLRVQEIGFEKYIDEQFDAVMSDYPEPPLPDNEQSLTPAQRRFFANAVHGPDQLRQRVAFALSQIWVASAARLSQARMMVPYLRLLQEHAFSNYRTLMEEVTLSPAMGRYLDMVNNVKPPANSQQKANENYAREIMQLFTVGTVKLNLDGSAALGADGTPVPTYTQADIEGLARVFTGWTFPVTPGQTARATNPAYYIGKMVAWEANHDTGAKTILDNYQIPAGQTAKQDLDTALDYLFRHPNVGPFLAKRLIGALVTSNPSHDYIARVAAVFNSDSQGRRGELKSVIQAILLDPEARAGDSSELAVKSGHLREPVYFLVSLLRALGARVAEENRLANYTSTMGQNLFYQPTVFNYFPLLERITVQGEDLSAPEFGILTPSNALARVNFVDAVAYQRLSPSVTIDLVPWVNLATVHPWHLCEALNRALLFGRMPEEMRERIMIALEVHADAGARAQAALYLVASSPLYQVQQ
jgi:uncharacterized protein (DUF1800 family)